MVYGRTPGDVVVRAGAMIESHNGGKAMLFAPHVVNAGSIRTPGGQTILAAGELVTLTQPTWADIDSKLRGYEVVVSAPVPYLLQMHQVLNGLKPVDPNFPTRYQNERLVLAELDTRAANVGYSVTNTGSVEATRGNITVMARGIAQNGTMLASTAFNSQDGSIILRAWAQGIAVLSSEFDTSFGSHSWRSGTLSFGGGSVTTVLADLTDTSSIELSAKDVRYRPGLIDLRGNLIDIQAGATVVAPSGTINAIASKEPIRLNRPPDGDKSIADGSRLYIGEDAILSAAGLRDVLLTMESNSVKAELRINELRDSVLYLDSWMRGATVYVDKRVRGKFADGPMSGVQWIKDEAGKYISGSWIGTALADVSGWIGTGTATLAELSAVGGTINLKSGGDIIVRANTVLDVSGGSVRFVDGYITATRLLGADGRVYNIGNASPDQRYIGVVRGFSRHHERVGITETWSSVFDRGNDRHFEQGYTEGRKAGGIYIYHGAGFAMDGELDGRVITGERQAALGEAAAGGLIQIGGGDPTADYSWLTSHMIVSGAPVRLADSFSVNSALPAAYFNLAGSSVAASHAKTTWLDAGMLSRSGMGTFNLFFNRSFVQEKGAELDLSPGAVINISKTGTASTGDSFSLGGIAINGNIRVAGGRINMIADAGIAIGDGVALDVSGQWVNEYASGAHGAANKVNGGEIKIAIDANAVVFNVGGTVSVAKTALLDVSGGGWLSRSAGKQKPVANGDKRRGADVVMLAGVGTAGPDYDAFAARYLDPANLAVSGTPLAEQSGKVAKTYEKDLMSWLKERYGFSGSEVAARAYFDALTPEQRNIFLREVYFAELTAGGREYNDQNSSRHGSYLRGRNAIAALFPNDAAYGGDITMFGGSGVRTQSGGDIQMFTPGGRTVIGVEGQVPPASAGLVTQGSGDIQLYSKGSILLGLSRIMTTFGGNIIAWSAEGDINAGRGSKTTVIYTPPKRVYDNYGGVILSSQVPSSGAGIATLNPIAEVAAGDVDLIAPMGTIDAGEAGIRVSGNVNLAALQIINAANIQVQGTSSGIPTVQAPSISAALSTSNAAAASQQTATPTQGSGNAQPSVIIVEVLGYGGGSGEEDDRKREQLRTEPRDERRTQNPNSPVQILGAGKLDQAAMDQFTAEERQRLVQ